VMQARDHVGDGASLREGGREGVGGGGGAKGGVFLACPFFFFSRRCFLLSLLFPLSSSFPPSLPPPLPPSLPPYQDGDVAQGNGPSGGETQN
jgi:hypothetical protein